jgi:UDP-N-acetylmuramoylalanine--D-glutamate ligase
MTNIHEDHLDRYDSLEEYARVKATITRHQSADDWLIINRDDDRLLAAVEHVGAARRLTYGLEPADEHDGLWIAADRFAGRWRSERLDLGAVADLQLVGAHARLNVLAAAAAALVMAVPPPEIAAALPGIAPVRDRLELVANLGGVRYVNDTTATVPAAAIAALRAFEGQPLIVIAGGSDKGVSFEELASELTRRAERVLLLDGAATPALWRRLAESGHQCTEGPYASLRAAVARGAQVAKPGDVVLLSPGCASFGMFRNEFHRGDEFRAAVAAVAGGEIGS